MVFAPDGSLLVCDGYQNYAAIRRVNQDGVTSTVHILKSASYCRSLSFDAAGLVLVASDTNILRLQPFGCGYGSASGNCTEVTFLVWSGQQYQVYSSRYDKSGNLYVSNGGYTVAKVFPNGTTSVFAGGGSLTAFNSGIFSYNPPGFVNGGSKVSMFNGAQGMVFDSAGNLFVADSGNFMIRKIAPDGTATTFAGINGQNPGDATQNAQAGGCAGVQTVCCCRTRGLVSLGRPYMQRHRVWQSNPAAFDLAVQLLAAAQPQLVATGLWLCESMMRRDDGNRWGQPCLLACMTADARGCCHPSHAPVLAAWLTSRGETSTNTGTVHAVA
jgi:hypothetical protein